MKKRSRFRRYLFWTIFIILFLLLEFFLYRSYLTLSVKVNGKIVKISQEATLKEVLQAAGFTLKRGDLLDSRGQLLRKGKGKPPVFLLNGRKASLSQELEEGDSITFFPGEDIKERLLTKVEVIPSPFTLSGRGTFLFIQRGKPGLKEITFGEKSGILLEEKTVKQPTETKVKRYDKSSKKVVALTFDDGPYQPYTLQVLNILRTKQVPATFFVVGKHIERYPQVLIEIASSGYDIGNHTYSHISLSKASYEQIVQELGQDENLIVKYTGKRARWFRPPEGKLSPLLIDTATAKGYRFVLWSVDTRDWGSSTPARIQQEILKNVGPGAVIIFHDGGGNQSATVAALPGIIDNLRAQGFTFVSLDELYASR